MKNMKQIDLSNARYIITYTLDNIINYNLYYGVSHKIDLCNMVFVLLNTPI